MKTITAPSVCEPQIITMSKEPDNNEIALQRAAEDGIHFAVKAGGNRFDALGRMVSFLEKQNVQDVTVQEIMTTFEEETSTSAEASRLSDE